MPIDIHIRRPRGSGSDGPPRPPANPNEVSIDHDRGLIWTPGIGWQPLLGPTSGAAYQELKRKEQERKQLNIHLRRQILSTWRCTECKRVWIGKDVRVKWRKVDGVNMETLVCPDPRCDGPVIIEKDAFSLTNPVNEAQAAGKGPQIVPQIGGQPKPLDARGPVIGESRTGKLDIREQPPRRKP